MSFQFLKVTDTSRLNPLKSAWRKSLSAPQDGMWEMLTDYAIHWEIRVRDQSTGYACIDGGNRLLQFFLMPSWMPEGVAALSQLLKEKKIKKGLIGTNNPRCLSVAMHLQKSVKVDTYLFSDFLEVKVKARAGKLHTAKAGELEKLVDFCHRAVGAPKAWLQGYLQGLITEEELFFLEHQGEILGTSEVRKSKTDLSIADVGMIVSPAHRRKGLGTYLLGKAKAIAIEWGRKPICSCEKDNTGSLKAIQSNGFRSVHQMLELTF